MSSHLTRVVFRLLCIQYLALAPIIALSQVIIRERIEIKPRAASLRSTRSTPTGMTTTVQLTWDADDDVTLYADGPCGANAVLSESGNRTKTYTIPYAVAGEYLFRAFYYGCNVFGSKPVPAANITATVTFGRDTTVVFQGSVPPRSACFGPPASIEWTYIHVRPYFNGFSLFADRSTIYTGEGNGFSFYSGYDCSSEERWYPERDSVTFTIISGSECGDLALGDGPRRDTVTLLAKDVPNLRFMPSGRLETFPVVVEARWNTIVSITSFNVRYSAILLGETKYYYAVEEEIEGEQGEPRRVLRIKETTSPTLPPGAVTSDIWAGNRWQDSPVSNFEDAPNSGKKLGVYWEKDKPVPGGGGDLPGGMIRLVGRYWHADSVYRVRLLASTDRMTNVVGVEVKKPARLGDAQGRARDVFDREINIDDSCIVYGGKYGIPPHFIKAQMDQESGNYNFGTGIGIGFAPSYRYEPFTAQLWPEVRNRRKNPFFVKESPVNDPPVPSHRYVQLIDYPYPNKTVWDMIFDHSQLVNNIDDQSYKVYGVRKPDNTMDFSPYDTIQVRYNEILKYFTDQDLGIAIAADSANQNMIAYLRDRWNGGAKNIKAQTRIAASYGLLQMMYTKALERKYREDREHLPEYLNITDTLMVLSMEYQKHLLKSGLSSSVESSSNWSIGYDNAFWTHLYGKWNMKVWYRNGVKAKSGLYPPQP